MWTKKTITMAVMGLALAVAAAACGDGGASAPGGGKRGTPVPTTAPLTGVPALDKTLAAVRAHDPRMLDALVVYSDVACGAPAQGAGGPPVCAAGETPGQAVRVLPATQCEGLYLRPNESLQALTGFTTDDVTVFGVWRTPERYYPAGEYSVVLDLFPMNMPHMSREIIVSADGIVGLNIGCGETPAGLVETRGLAQAVVPPGAEATR